MAMTAASLGARTSLTPAPCLRNRQLAGVHSLAGECLTCRLMRPMHPPAKSGANGGVQKGGEKCAVKNVQPVESSPPCAETVRREDGSPVGLSRRAALAGGVLLSASVGGGTIAGVPNAEAAEEPVITRKVFFDITVDGEPIGRFTVGLYGDDAPIGTARFVDLATGKQAVGYRRRPIEIITPTFIQGAPLISLYPGGNRSAGTPITGGETTGPLLEEMERQKGRLYNTQHTVSLLVIDSKKEAAKQKLVAANGRFYVVEESSRPEPNGTAFAIATSDAPELDKTNLVIGRVVDGLDVVKRLASVPVNKDNSGSGFFQVGKLIGDRRAIVAERGFYRPFAKVLVASCGELAQQE